MVEFEPCPKCHMRGRREVFARYADKHGYCFWCGHYEPAPVFERMERAYRPTQSALALPGDAPFSAFAWPHDSARAASSSRAAFGASTTVDPFPMDAMPYHLMDDKGLDLVIGKYKFTPAEVVTNRILWSARKQWLIFPYNDPIEDNKVGAWQARDEDHFRPADQPKWLNFGQPQKLLYTLNEGSDILILVEDIISAIKVARQGLAVMPLFSKTLDTNRLMAIAGGYAWLVLWLDKDAEKDSFRAAAKARQFMGNTDVIVTEFDPKFYSDDQIREQLEKRSIIA